MTTTGPSVDDLAPPYIRFVSPYGGLGLRARTAARGRARIDDLLAAHATDVSMRVAELEDTEPSTQAVVEALFGPYDPNVGFRDKRRPGSASEVAAAGQTHDAVARQAWTLFGPPQAMSGRYHPKLGYRLGWRWLVEDDPVACPERLDAWFPFLIEHQSLMDDDYATRVGVRAIWDFRLVSAAGVPTPPAYPTSRIHAHLRGKHASAFFDLVFPYDGATDAFLADHRAVCSAMKLEMPMGGFKLSTRKKRGDGRVLKRLS